MAGKYSYEVQGVSKKACAFCNEQKLKPEVFSWPEYIETISLGKQDLLVGWLVGVKHRSQDNNSTKLMIRLIFGSEYQKLVSLFHAFGWLQTFSSKRILIK